MLVLRCLMACFSVCSFPVQSFSLRLALIRTSTAEVSGLTTAYAHPPPMCVRACVCVCDRMHVCLCVFAHSIASFHPKGISL